MFSRGTCRTSSIYASSACWSIVFWHILQTNWCLENIQTLGRDFSNPRRIGLVWCSHFVRKRSFGLWRRSLSQSVYGNAHQVFQKESKTENSGFLFWASVDRVCIRWPSLKDASKSCSPRKYQNGCTKDKVAEAGVVWLWKFVLERKRRVLDKRVPWRCRGQSSARIYNYWSKRDLPQWSDEFQRWSSSELPISYGVHTWVRRSFRAETAQLWSKLQIWQNLRWIFKNSRLRSKLKKCLIIEGAVKKLFGCEEFW